MITNNVEQRVHSIVREVMRVAPERLTPQARFREDLGADSLDLVSLMMALEDEFKGRITKEQEEQLQTVGAAVDFIRTHLSTAVTAR